MAFVRPSRDGARRSIGVQADSAASKIQSKANLMRFSVEEEAERRERHGRSGVFRRLDARALTWSVAGKWQCRPALAGLCFEFALAQLWVHPDSRALDVAADGSAVIARVDRLKIDLVWIRGR